MPSSGEVGLASASSLPHISPLAPSVKVLAMRGSGWVAGLVPRPSMDPATPVEVEVPCASAESPVVGLPSHSKWARPRWTCSDRRCALFEAPSWLVRASASGLLCPSSSCSSWGLETCSTHRMWEELRFMLAKALSFCASPSSR